MATKKEMLVSAIKDGTVIDHIPVKHTFRVMGILKPERFRGRVVIATNLTSKKHGRKGIIKISGHQLEREEAQKIAIIAPTVTLSVIRDFRVLKKIKLALQDDIRKIVRCNNPSCITNNDNVGTEFHLESRKPLMLRCHHCERCMSEEDIELT